MRRNMRAVRGASGIVTPCTDETIVIKSGSSKMTAVDVARSFLSQKDRNLMNLYEMSYDEMKKIHGIGDVIAMQLKCIAELSTRIANTRHFEGIQMRSAATVAE